MKRHYLLWALRLLGPTLLVLFLATSDLQKFLSILAGAAFGPILLSLLLMPPFLIIKTWRWKLLLRELGLDVPFWRGFALYTVGIYYGSVTPGQAGDLVKAWYLRERGQPLAPAMLSVVLDRLCDLLVMSAVAVLGIVALGRLLPIEGAQTLLVVLVGAGLVVVMVLLTARRPRHWLLSVLLPRLLPGRLSASLQRWNEQFAALSLTPRLVVLVGVASLISAGFTFWRLWLLFVALDVVLPLTIVVGVSALIAVLQVLPISIGGVGVRDAVLIAVMTTAPYTYSQEQAISVSALFLLLTLEHILAGFILSFWFPLDAALKQSDEISSKQAETTGEHP
jgi:uncharacterized protein (TIRG00374 family)